MTIIGTETLQQGGSFKAVLNETGVLLFPTSQQHFTMKVAGISYEDDYRGNALAAIFQPGHCEIRGHQDFSPARVQAVWDQLARQSGLEALRSYRVLYQGKAL